MAERITKWLLCCWSRFWKFSVIFAIFSTSFNFLYDTSIALPLQIKIDNYQENKKYNLLDFINIKVRSVWRFLRKVLATAVAKIGRLPQTPSKQKDSFLSLLFSAFSKWLFTFKIWPTIWRTTGSWVNLHYFSCFFKKNKHIIWMNKVL